MNAMKWEDKKGTRKVIGLQLDFGPGDPQFLNADIEIWGRSAAEGRKLRSKIIELLEREYNGQ